MEDLKTFLIDKVLTFGSDTLTPETEKILQQVRREKTDKPVIFVSSGTSSFSRTTPSLHTNLVFAGMFFKVMVTPFLFLFSHFFLILSIPPTE